MNRINPPLSFDWSIAIIILFFCWIILFYFILSCNLGQARPLLKENFVEELVDPRLRKCYSEKELNSMLRCASMCIRRDPHLRPRMSQVGNLNFSFKSLWYYFLSIIYISCNSLPESRGGWLIIRFLEKGVSPTFSLQYILI